MEPRGAVNVYQCESCRGRHPTINLNAGTTPFISRCPYCHGNAMSNFYLLDSFYVDKLRQLQIEVVWYRPRPEEFSKLALDTQEHIVFGGLISGRIESADPILDEITPDWKLDGILMFIHAAYNISDELRKRIARRTNLVAAIQATTKDSESK